MFSRKPCKKGSIYCCPKPPRPTKQIFIKTCKPDPFLYDIPCRPNTTINGKLIKTEYTDPCNNEQSGFIIETFEGECLVPINFEELCLNVSGCDGLLVTIVYEDVSDFYTSCLGRPVRLLRALKLWKGEVRAAEGVVRVSPVLDSNGDQFFQIVDTRQEVQVVLIPVHTMGVSDDLSYMASLVGSTVSIKYVDFSTENPNKRCGIPITIIELTEL